MESARTGLALAAAVIHARDPEKLAEFYCQALRVTPAKAYTSDHFGLKLPNGYLGIERLAPAVPGTAETTPPPGPSRVVLWFETPDVESELRRWIALGARQRAAPSAHESAGEIIATVLDPEGNEIGLVSHVRQEASGAQEGA